MGNYEENSFSFSVLAEWSKNSVEIVLSKQNVFATARSMFAWREHDICYVNK